MKKVTDLVFLHSYIYIYWHIHVYLTANATSFFVQTQQHARDVNKYATDYDNVIQVRGGHLDVSVIKKIYILAVLKGFPSWHEFIMSYFYHSQESNLRNDQVTEV